MPPIGAWGGGGGGGGFLKCSIWGGILLGCLEDILQLKNLG